MLSITMSRMVQLPHLAGRLPEEDLEATLQLEISDGGATIILGQTSVKQITRVYL